MLLPPEALVGLGGKGPFGAREAVGVVEDAVEDGVGESLVSEVLVPGLVRELAGHDRRAWAVAVLEEVAALLLARGLSDTGRR
jgi:hypothetical protein